MPVHIDRFAGRKIGRFGYVKFGHAGILGRCVGERRQYLRPLLLSPGRSGGVRFVQDTRRRFSCQYKNHPEIRRRFDTANFRVLSMSGAMLHGLTHGDLLVFVAKKKEKCSAHFCRFDFDECRVSRRKDHVKYFADICHKNLRCADSYGKLSSGQ